MKLRRKRGATLGLVAACVFLVIVVGVGFFFLSKIIGGGREVANATDAGALNVAKAALRKGAVPLSAFGLTDEFGALTVNPDGSNANGNVDLVTYNRLVAQALIVAKNAELEGTATAKGNATYLAGQVKAIGNQLNKNLSTGTLLDGDFNSIASLNNTKMWNGSPVQLNGAIQAGYMKQPAGPKAGGSMNVYMDNATLAAIDPSWTPASSGQGSLSGKGNYLAGYTNFSFFGSPLIMGVPVGPQTKPHLVDVGQFNTVAPDPDTPPNSFRTNSKALEAKSGGVGGSLACAIVGTIKTEYQAAIPRGYIRIVNGPDATSANGAPSGFPVSNGANDIFNNELFSPPGSGIYQNSSNVPGREVFSTNGGSLSTALSVWAGYVKTMPGHPGYDPTWAGNAVTDGSPNYGGGDPTYWTTNNLSDYLTNPAKYDLHAGNDPTQPYATFNDLINMAGYQTNCLYTMYDASMSPTDPCATSLGNWMGNYNRDITNGPGTQPGGFTNVEFMKADLLGKVAGRKGGHFCASVGPSGASGLKAWPTDASGNAIKSGAYGSGAAMAFEGGGTHVNFMSVSTPLTYLKQLGTAGGAPSNGQPATCAYNSIIDDIWTRLKIVEPTVSRASVVAALGDTNYPLNLQGDGTSKLYLYVDSSKNAKMTDTLPWKDTGLAADGPAPSGANKCDSSYPLNGWAVNTASYQGMGGGPGVGDGNYHEAPFTQPAPGTGPNGTDSALFQLGSGYNNLLGELRFQETVEGATFCKPN